MTNEWAELVWNVLICCTEKGSGRWLDNIRRTFSYYFVEAKILKKKV